MKIYLIRHAIAEARAEEIADEDRQLTAKGRERFAMVVAGLNKLGVRFDRIYHSPMRRAVQTGQLLTSLTDAPLSSLRALAEPPAERLLKKISGDCLALVGHEPWLSELVAILTTGSDSDGRAFRFKKGGVAWLEGRPEPGGMELCALLPPRVFRKAE